jgi:hypothetical protein
MEFGIMLPAATGGKSRYRVDKSKLPQGGVIPPHLCCSSITKCGRESYGASQRCYGAPHAGMATLSIERGKMGWLGLLILLLS